MQGKCPCLQPGHLDQGLQQKVQLINLGCHCLKEFILFLLRQAVPLHNIRKHPDIRNGRLHLMGYIADQLLNGLPLLFNLPYSLLYRVRIRYKLPLHLRKPGILIRLIILWFSSLHESVYCVADFIGKPGLLPVLPKLPCMGQQKNKDAGSGQKRPRSLRGYKACQRP